ncbi:MAG: CBO0543 family protein [Candidatus Pristimantibacillus sp.]
MTINIIVGFVIPWIFGIILWKKSPIVIYLVSPISATVSAFFNDIGYHLGFWDFTPKIDNDETLSALPMDLGLYPVMACYMIYWIVRSNRHAWMKIALFSLFNTVLEFIALQFGKAEYGNGWNIGWTFVSYVLALLLVYLYYKLLHRYDLFNKVKS